MVIMKRSMKMTSGLAEEPIVWQIVIEGPDVEEAMDWTANDAQIALANQFYIEDSWKWGKIWLENGERILNTHNDLLEEFEDWFSLSCEMKWKWAVITTKLYDSFEYTFNIVFEWNEKEGYMAKVSSFPKFLSTNKQESKEEALLQLREVLIGALDEFWQIKIYWNPGYNLRKRFQKDFIKHTS